MSLLRPSISEFRQDLPDPAEVVFAWHSRPGAAPRLMPPWLPGRFEQEAANLRDGTAVVRFPAGRRWVAQHVEAGYEPGRAFVDTLASRPFVVPLFWHHTHEIRPQGSGSVLVDRVATQAPDRMLRQMFAYRHRVLADDLAAHRGAIGTAPLTIAVSGASGLVGSSLVPFLTTGGHRVVRLVRHDASGPDERRWDPLAPDPASLAGVDAVVHLAGHSIAGRFTQAHKEKIRSSRITPTRLLAQAATEAGVRVFVCSSAIGIYGADRGDEELTESSAPGTGFLADVVADWEDAAASGADAMRVVMVRTGIVQSPRGGALRLQRPLFSAGLGGRMGSGEQWQSWIAIDDLVDIFHRALYDDRMVGPVNAVAPKPVRQAEYAAALGHALHRPTLLPTPRVGPRILLGAEGSQEVALASQRVVPEVLAGLGHRFRFAEVEQALRYLLGSAR